MTTTQTVARARFGVALEALTRAMQAPYVTAQAPAAAARRAQRREFGEELATAVSTLARAFTAAIAVGALSTDEIASTRALTADVGRSIRLMAPGTTPGPAKSSALSKTALSKRLRRHSSADISHDLYEVRHSLDHIGR